MTTGIVVVAFFAALCAVRSFGTTRTSTLRRTNSCCQLRQSFIFPVSIPVLHVDVLSFNVAKIAKALTKCILPGAQSVGSEAPLLLKTPIRATFLAAAPPREGKAHGAKR